MKKIKKVQKSCNLLYIYTTEKEDTYDGVVLDKIEGGDEYVIYINKTKHLIYIKTHNQIEKSNVNLIKYKTYKLKYTPDDNYQKKRDLEAKKLQESILGITSGYNQSDDNLLEY